ncbi:class I SAM-dependent methyltransferase [Planomonospora parontospora]|uniref:class I SAM-dependent methyltransferase n=1 Tax=Planomonospora parontospora TaxID=58119 RepID=UPI001670D227|nr:class I SAM-dependent methyltransferase [Planomonospora parontospora]GGL50485.1 hypothetical protein GCM10014719_59710 [Planomonospora parontospora subsp. antibiotica]GII18989.1 hypothetical protein Ppa05_57150 [Planomonospora parontospora subsp. antibiotica]
MLDDWGPDPLFGPFLRIHERFPDVPVISYYEDDFYVYGRDAAWPQVWDVPAITALAERVDPKAIMDLGCGEGRISWNLVKRGFTGPIMGVDNSPSAMKAFTERFAPYDQAHFELRDATGPASAVTECDLIVMGSVTINSFCTEQRLNALLQFINASLPTGGHAILLAYQDQILEGFEQLSGAMDAVDFTDSEGVQRLIWRGVHYRDQDFRQNYFIEHSGSRFPGVLGVLRERIWTATELRALAESVGLQVVNREVATVDDGGAEGWSCDALLFRKGSV